MNEQKDAIDIAAEQCMARIQAAISESQPVSAADAAWMWKTIEYQRRELDIHECADELREAWPSLCESELKKLQELFKLSPLDLSEITPAICEKVGLQSESRPLGASVWYDARGTVVWKTGVLCGVQNEPSITTAGQLAMLVAARRVPGSNPTKGLYADHNRYRPQLERNGLHERHSRRAVSPLAHLHQ